MVQSVAFIPCVKATPIPSRVDLRNRRATSDRCAQNRWRNTKKRNAERAIAQGRVKTQASAILRRVDICTPEPLAAIVPATPEERTWVVETGRPKLSAAAIVPIATISAAAPWP
jgi:hypothetical protein